MSTEPICKQKQHVKVRISRLEGCSCNNSQLCMVAGLQLERAKCACQKFLGSYSAVKRAELLPCALCC